MKSTEFGVRLVYFADMYVLAVFDLVIILRLLYRI
jgi:hypothetical protein